MCFGDPDVVDGPDLRLKVFGHVVDKDVAVDLLCLAFEPALETEGRIPAKALRKVLCRCSPIFALFSCLLIFACSFIRRLRRCLAIFGSTLFGRS